MAKNCPIFFLRKKKKTVFRDFALSLKWSRAGHGEWGITNNSINNLHSL